MKNDNIRKVLQSLLYSAILVILCSCNPSQSALERLEAFADELEEYSSDYTMEDWNAAEEEFTEICEELSQDEYTTEELRYIGKLKGRCAKHFTNYYIKDFESESERIIEELYGVMEGFTE